MEIEQARTESGLWRTEEAAKYLGVAPETLTIWRHQKRGPDYIKIGNHVGYTQNQLDAFIQNSNPLSSFKKR